MKVDHIYQGNCLEILKIFSDESIDCVVTSPPYWALRDYGISGQLGLEPTFQEYIDKLVAIFDEVKRVLKKTGTCWVNLGDTYSGEKIGNTNGKWQKINTNSFKKQRQNITAKSLLQIPSRFAIAMTDNGWILRNEIIWYKPNAMPSSAKDRFTNDFEKLFFFTKSKKYYFETQWEKAIIGYNNSKFTTGKTFEAHKNTSLKERKESDKRLKRAVWKIPTRPFKEAHFAVFPEKLVEPMIKAGCAIGGVVLDPFMGSGTTGLVAKKLQRHYIGIELNPEYIKIAEKRIGEFLW